MTEVAEISKTFFSIGVTTYNRVDVLRDTLKTLLSQKFQNFEIIIGNDYIEEELNYNILGIFDDRIKIINNIHNLGEFENMNSILKHAKGEYFTWVYDDDPCSVHFLENVYFAVENFKKPICIYTSFVDFYGSGAIKFEDKETLRIAAYTGKAFLKKYLEGGVSCLGCSGAFKRSYLEKIGGAPRISNSKMALYTEYALIMMACQEEEIIYIDNKLVSARNHLNSWSVYNDNLDLFKEAGLELLRRSIVIFMDRELIGDFNLNLNNLNKSILGTIIVKIIQKRNKFDKNEYLDYLNQFESIIERIPNQILRNNARNDLKIIQKLNIFHILKGYIKVYINKKFLFRLMKFKSFLRVFKYKSF